MGTQSPQELVQFLTRNQILGKSLLDTLEHEAGNFETAQQFTDELVLRGWLTEYQKTQLLFGKVDKLVLGPYRLIEPLGEGGMAKVFKAWHPKLDRIVALKIIRTNPFTFRPELVSRFNREARAIAKFQHPNLVVLFDADEVDDTHYIAMEFVNGSNLEKMVRRHGPLAIRQACEYMRQTSLGLQHAADCGLVHRDIKPSNILVAPASIPGRSSIQMKRPDLETQRDRSMTPSPIQSDAAWGIIKVLDMGLARLRKTIEEYDPSPATPLTQMGTLLGTPDFISPEQARDARSVDIRSDLYSLGCTFYFILTGQPPYQGGNAIQKLVRHETEKPYPIEALRPQIPAFVTQMVQRLMEKKPENRYQTPQEVADALAEYLALPASPSDGRSQAPSIPPVEQFDTPNDSGENDRKTEHTTIIPEMPKPE